jgi:flavin-dependent dehydrogenase
MSLNGYRIFQNGAYFQIPERTGLVGVARAELDDLLLRRVRESSSVDLLMGEKATLREVGPRGCRVAVGSKEVRGGILIIADGANSPMLRSLGRYVPAPKSARLGTSSGWRVALGSLEPKVHTFLVPGGEVYFTPLTNGRVNVSALGSLGLIQELSHEHTLRAKIRRMSESLEVSLSLEHPPISCGSISTQYRGARCQEAFVVGDACETFDPCAGFGMTHALMSGRLAGESVLKALGEADLSSALAYYERTREARVRDVRGFTRLTAATMVSSLGRRSLPFLISTGVAAVVAESVHRADRISFVRRVVSAACGRRVAGLPESVA